MLTVLVAALTSNDTVAKYGLGALTVVNDDTYGRQVWRYIYNASASSLTAGLGAMSKDSLLKYQAELSGAATPRVRMLGVAQHTLVTLSWGWILCDGYGLIQSNATQTVNKEQKTAAAGQFTDGAIGTDEIVAFAIGDDAGAAVNVTGLISML